MPSKEPVPSTSSETDVASALGWRLKHARTTRKMTMRVLSEASGSSEAMICKIEKGRALPSLMTLISLARALEVPPSWMLEDCRT